jgi:hypothetical protein
MIFVEYVGVNIDFQIPLLIIDAIMSTYSRTHRVTPLTLIDARVVLGFMELFWPAWALAHAMGWLGLGQSPEPHSQATRSLASDARQPVLPWRPSKSLFASQVDLMRASIKQQRSDEPG